MRYTNPRLLYCKGNGKGSYFTVKVKVKVKEVDLYSAFIVVPHTRGARVRITREITSYLPLPRKHSPDGASPD